MDDALVTVVDFLVLEFPRMGVRDVHGAKARAHCRIDVRARTVADHEGTLRREACVVNQAAVGRDVLFARRFDPTEERRKSGALQFQ